MRAKTTCPGDGGIDGAGRAVGRDRGDGRSPEPARGAAAGVLRPAGPGSTTSVSGWNRSERRKSSAPERDRRRCAREAHRTSAIESSTAWSTSCRPATATPVTGRKPGNVSSSPASAQRVPKARRSLARSSGEAAAHASAGEAVVPAVRAVGVAVERIRNAEGLARRGQHLLGERPRDAVEARKSPRPGRRAGAPRSPAPGGPGDTKSRPAPWSDGSSAGGRSRSRPLAETKSGSPQGIAKHDGEQRERVPGPDEAARKPEEQEDHRGERAEQRVAAHRGSQRREDPGGVEARAVLGERGEQPVERALRDPRGKRRRHRSRRSPRSPPLRGAPDASSGRGRRRTPRGERRRSSSGGRT